MALLRNLRVVNLGNFGPFTDSSKLGKFQVCTPAKAADLIKSTCPGYLALISNHRINLIHPPITPTKQFTTVQNDGTLKIGSQSSSNSNANGRHYFGALLGFGVVIMLGTTLKLHADEISGISFHDIKEIVKVIEPGKVKSGEDAGKDTFNESVIGQKIFINPKSEENLCLDTINEYDFDDFATSASVFWALVSERELEEEKLIEEGNLCFDFNGSFYHALGIPALRRRAEWVPFNTDSLSEDELQYLRAGAQCSLLEAHNAVMLGCVQRIHILMQYRDALFDNFKKVEDLSTQPDEVWRELAKGNTQAGLDDLEAEIEFMRKKTSLQRKEQVLNPVLRDFAESLFKMRRACLLLGVNEAVESLDEEFAAWKLVILDLSNEIDLMSTRMVIKKIQITGRKLGQEIILDQESYLTESYWQRMKNWRHRRSLAHRVTLQQSMALRQVQLLQARKEILLQRREEIGVQIKKYADYLEKFMNEDGGELDEEKEQSGKYKGKTGQDKEKADAVEIETLGRFHRMITKDRVKPATTKDHVKPATTKDHVKPATTKDHVKPATTKDHVKPATTKDHVKPATTAQDHVKPATITKDQ